MENLNKRLEAIAASLQNSGQGVALLALGSVGIETERADAYSDIDFFAFVESGTKSKFMEDTSWLNADNQVIWIFQNSRDGFKLLWADGIFGEMAIFELSELPTIAYAPGRLIWHKKDIDPLIFANPQPAGHRNLQPDIFYNQQELLTNLYVGLGRYLRGEKFSAWRFVQTHALNLALGILEAEVNGLRQADLYNLDRRIETRVPSANELISQVVGGVEHTPTAATALLDWLLARGYSNDALVVEVKKLLAKC